MNLTVRNAQFHFHAEPAALLLEAPPGPDGKPLFRVSLNTTQEALTARTNGGAGGGVWAEAEVLAEAQALLDVRFPGQGFLAVAPAKPEDV